MADDEIADGAGVTTPEPALRPNGTGAGEQSASPPRPEDHTDERSQLVTSGDVPAERSASTVVEPGDAAEHEQVSPLAAIPREDATPPSAPDELARAAPPAPPDPAPTPTEVSANSTPTPAELSDPPHSSPSSSEPPASPTPPSAQPTAEPLVALEPATTPAMAADGTESSGSASPEAADEPSPIDAVLLEIERVNVRVEELARLSQRQMEHIDRLHAENQQLRAGELRQAVAPILRSLIRHHDNVAKMVETAADADEGRALRDVRGGVLGVLSIAGVSPFAIGPKEPFDPARHQGVSRIDTTDANLDGSVARMRRCGFVADDGRVVRQAEVDVYRMR